MGKTVEAQGPVDVRVRPVAIRRDHGVLEFLPGYHDLTKGTKLYAIPDGWREEIEELFGEYWDCAYQEGHLNRLDGNKANQILHRLRQLLPNGEVDASPASRIAPLTSPVVLGAVSPGKD